MPVIGVAQDITAIVGRVLTHHFLIHGNKRIVVAFNHAYQGLNQGLTVAQADIRGQSHTTETLCVLTRIKKLLMIGMSQVIPVRQLAKLKHKHKHCHALLTIQAVSHKLKQSHAHQVYGVHG